MLSRVRLPKRRSPNCEARESEARYQGLFEGLNVGLYKTRPDGRIEDVNSTLVKLLGYSDKETLLQRPAEESYFIPQDRRRWRDLIEEKGAVQDFEIQWRAFDGSPLWVSENARAVRDEHGKVLCYEGVVTDISSRKLLEEEMYARARQQATIAELGQHALVTDDFQQFLHETIHQVAQRLQVELGEVLELLPSGDTFLLVSGVGWEQEAVDREIVSAGPETQAGYTLLKKEPITVENFETETRFGVTSRIKHHHVMSGMSAIIGSSEKPHGVLVVYTRQQCSFSIDEIHFLQAAANILAAALDRRKAEQALRESEERFRQLVEDAADAFYLIDQDGRLVEVNRQACESLGYTQAELLGLNIADVDVDFASLESFRDFMHGLVLGQPTMQERRHRRKDGRELSVEVRTSLIEMGGKPMALELARDITSRILAEKQIKEARDFYLNVLQDAPVMIWRSDASGCCDWFNETWLRFRGNSLSRELATNWKETIHPDDLPALERTYRVTSETLEPYQNEYRLRRYDGEYRWILEVANPIWGTEDRFMGYLGYCLDFTDRKSAEDDLRKRTEEIRLLHETGHKLTSTLDLQTIFRDLHQIISGVMDCVALYVSTYDASDRMIRCLFAIQDGSVLDVDQFPPIPLAEEGRGTQSLVIRSGQPLLFSDYLAQRHTSPNYYLVTSDGITDRGTDLEEKVTRSAIMVPMKLDGRVTGIIQVFSYKLNAYSDEDVRFLEGLALQTTAAVHNASLYQRAQVEITERRKAEQALRENAYRFQAIFNHHYQLTGLLDPDGRILAANLAMQKFVGKKESELVGMLFWEAPWFAHSLEVQEQTHQAILRCRRGESIHYETTHQNALSEIRYFDFSLNPVLDETGEVIYLVPEGRDITENLQAENALKGLNSRLGTLIEVGIALAQTLELHRVYQIAHEHVSRLVDCPNFSISLLHSDRELRMEFAIGDGREFETDLFPSLEIHKRGPVRGRARALKTGQPELMNELRQVYEQAVAEGEAYHFSDERAPDSALYVPMIVQGKVIGLLEVQSYEANAYNADQITLLVSVANQVGLAVENARLYERARRELHERRQAEKALRESEQQIRNSLAEKEILLREIHHRVKNNLEVIISLADMQARMISDPKALQSIRELQERVRTIALVHEDLYHSNNLANIHAQTYLLKLTDNLFQVFGSAGIDLKVEATDLLLDVETAIPLGLVVTELLTNAIKHAFPGRAEPAPGAEGECQNQIRLRLYEDETHYLLEVSDNGVGLPAGVDWRTSRSLGLRLVNRLSAQLHGRLEMDSSVGTCFRLIMDKPHGGPTGGE